MFKGNKKDTTTYNYKVYGISLSVKFLKVDLFHRFE